MTIGLDDLTLHYQPQVSADGSRVVGVEALIRPIVPTEGLRTPGDILKHFEDPDEAERLDYWIFRRACTDAVRWPSVTIGINITAERFRDPNLAPRLSAIAAEIGIDPRRIEVEIVERAYIGDFSAALVTIEQLRAHGIRIAIDDFGTGYSSLSYLLRLPIDKVKIDKSFVDEVHLVKSAAIVHAIVALARALGLKVTAEGVETPEQHRFLRVAGCHTMQGWLFHKAMPAEEIDALVTTVAPGEL